MRREEAGAEKYRQAVAKRYGLDINELPPVPSGKSIRLKHYEIEKAEFDAKAPYIGPKASAELSKALADAKLAQDRASNWLKFEGQKIGISGMNANTARYNALIRAAQVTGKNANSKIDASILSLEQKLHGEEAAQKADPNKLKHAPKIDSIKAQIEFLNSKKVPVEEPQQTGFEPYTPQMTNVQPLVPGPIKAGPKPTKATPKPKAIKTKGWTIESE